jgi:hypothetical protein
MAEFQVAIVFESGLKEFKDSIQRTREAMEAMRIQMEQHAAKEKPPVPPPTTLTKSEPAWGRKQRMAHRRRHGI